MDLLIEDPQLLKERPGHKSVCKNQWAAVPDLQITIFKPNHREQLSGFQSACALGTGLC